MDWKQEDVLEDAVLDRLGERAVLYHASELVMDLSTAIDEQELWGDDVDFDPAWLDATGPFEDIVNDYRI